jgi:hypothetical protein
MSLKGLTMRSQRQAAYGLIPDSVIFSGSSFHLTTVTSGADLACWRYDSDL